MVYYAYHTHNTTQYFHLWNLCAADELRAVRGDSCNKRVKVICHPDIDGSESLQEMIDFTQMKPSSSGQRAAMEDQGEPCAKCVYKHQNINVRVSLPECVVIIVRS